MRLRAALWTVLLGCAAGCGGSCGKPGSDLTVIQIPAFGAMPAEALLFDLDPKPTGTWDVTPLANAVYQASKQCPDDVAKGALTARFSVSDGKTAAPAVQKPGGSECVEKAVLGRDVAGLPTGKYRVVVHLVPNPPGDAG